MKHNTQSKKSQHKLAKTQHKQMKTQHRYLKSENTTHTSRGGDWVPALFTADQRYLLALLVPMRVIVSVFFAPFFSIATSTGQNFQ